MQAAEYRGDTENQRARKTVGDATTVYFLDCANEVEASDCFGIVKRRYDYGDGVAELIIVDGPVLDSTTTSEVGTLVRDGGTTTLVTDLGDCIGLLGTVSAGSGPCVIGGGGTMYASSCMVCVQNAWTTAGTNESVAVSGCFECDAGAEYDAAGIFVAPEATCHPCLPHMNGFIETDGATWMGFVEVDAGCAPCPVPVLNASAAAMDAESAPVVEHSDLSPRDCVSLDLAQRRFFLQDEQRSVYALVDVEGVVVEGYEYDPYGAVLVLTPGSSGVVEFSTNDGQGTAQDASTPYLYTGRRYDPESGFMQYRTRYYDVEMGRFISKDTIGVWGDPNSLGNGYGYGGNGAHNRIDSDGRNWWTWMEFIGGQLLEAAQRAQGNPNDTGPLPRHVSPLDRGVSLYDFLTDSTYQGKYEFSEEDVWWQWCRTGWFWNRHDVRCNKKDDNMLNYRWDLVRAAQAAIERAQDDGAIGGVIVAVTHGQEFPNAQQREDWGWEGGSVQVMPCDEDNVAAFYVLPRGSG